MKIVYPFLLLTVSECNADHSGYNYAVEHGLGSQALHQSHV